MKEFITWGWREWEGGVLLTEADTTRGRRCRCQLTKPLKLISLLGGDTGHKCCSVQNQYCHYVML